MSIIFNFSNHNPRILWYISILTHFANIPEVYSMVWRPQECRQPCAVLQPNEEKGESKDEDDGMVKKANVRHLVFYRPMGLKCIIGQLFLVRRSLSA